MSATNSGVVQLSEEEEPIIQLYAPELQVAAANCSMDAASAGEALQTVRLAVQNDAKVSQSTLVATIVVVLVVSAILVGVIAYMVISSCHVPCPQKQPQVL